MKAEKGSEIITTICEYENSVAMPDNERLTYLDTCGIARLKDGNGNVKAQEAYASRCSEYLRFGHEVDLAACGAYSPYDALKVCDTPEIFLKTGFEQRPMLYTQKHLFQALTPKSDYNPHRHGFSIEQVKRFPQLLASPVVLANSPTREDVLLAILLATDAYDTPLIAGIKPDGTGNYGEREVETNMVLSVYTAICERYAVQFLPPAVYDVSESTVSVDGGVLKLTAKRLSDAGFTAVFPNISNSRVREDSDTGNPWVPAGSHTLAGISCSITEGETTPPAPYTEGTLITDMASIAKYVKDPEIREILKRKDDGKKGEHGGIGTTATRSSIIEGLKTRGYLEERKGKVRATDKAKAFYALLPPEIRGADVTARWWLIQQDIADGKADVNALQDSVIEVFNHHRETAYVGASIAGAGKTVVGKCPRCGKDVIKTGSIYACSSIKNEKQEDGTWKEVAGCGFKLFGFCTKKFTEKQAASLLDGKAVSLRGCKSKAGKTFDCTVVLQKDGSVEPIFTPRKPTKKGRR